MGRRRAFLVLSHLQNEKIEEGKKKKAKRKKKKKKGFLGETMTETDDKIRIFRN